MDPHALSGLGRNDGFHSPGVSACFPTSPRLVVQPDRSRGEDVHVTRPQFPLQCPLFWSWSPKPSQLSLTACPYHVLGQTVPGNIQPLGGQTRRKRLESNERKSLSGLVLLVAPKEAAAGSSPARSGLESSRCEQHRCRDRHSGSMGHSWLHGPCFWLLRSPRKCK